MSELQEQAGPSARRFDDAPTGAIWRPTAEFVIVLVLSILIFRTFAAEAYVVPTGSMAPTLLGLHRDVGCPNCRIHFAVGTDERGRSGRPVCPNCGFDDLPIGSAVDCGGDRLLVQKFLFDIRPPRRWEVAVFQSPAEPSQAYVKRVVGLPGDAIQIRRGDVAINGRVARKSLAEQRGMRVLVHDHDFIPKDSDRFPRWIFRPAGSDRARPTGWSAQGTRFVRRPTDLDSAGVDWLEYRHWESDRGRFGPILDFSSYNGADLRGENPVADLMLQSNVRASADLPALLVRFDRCGDRFVVTIPVDGQGPPQVRRNGRELDLSGASGGLASGVPSRVEASVVDCRLLVAIDGRLLFDPIDFDDPADGPSRSSSPIGLGVPGGSVDVGSLKIFRDVYYTSSLANTPKRPFGVDAPYQLGADEYFVLGDNSAVSNDSRFWDGSPVVRGTLLLGKPFLVHLPGQVVPLEVFGRSVYWIPDPWEIRYIR